MAEWHRPLAAALLLALAGAAPAAPQDERAGGREPDARRAPREQQEPRADARRVPRTAASPDAPRQGAAPPDARQGNGQAPRPQGAPSQPPRSAPSGDGRQRWQQLSPDDRQRLQQREQQFRTLPREEQQRAQAAEQRYRSMNPQQRDELRRRWEGMSEAERERYRQKIREQQ